MPGKKRPPKAEARAARWPPGKQRLKELVDEAIVDAYGELEQRVAFLTMLEEHVGLPFETQVLGVPVVVERIDLSTTDEIVAICRGVHSQAISILELRLPKPPPPGAEWIEAYRYFARGGESSGSQADPQEPSGLDRGAEKAPPPEECGRRETRLRFRSDREADNLDIDMCPAHAEQASDELCDEV